MLPTGHGPVSTPSSTKSSSTTASSSLSGAGLRYDDENDYLSHISAVLRSQNLPLKVNCDGRRGIDAITGRSNFDISE